MSLIELSSPATVRMLVLRDGQPWIASEGRFEEGMPAVLDDPRYERPAAGASTQPGEDFAGKPRDAQVVGTWTDRRRQLRFTAEGAVMRRHEGEEIEVARWWYDYPNDVFEELADTGTGGLRWADSGQVSQLRLGSRAGKELVITTGGRQRRLERVER